MGDEGVVGGSVAKSRARGSGRRAQKINPRPLQTAGVLTLGWLLSPGGSVASVAAVVGVSHLLVLFDLLDEIVLFLHCLAALCEWPGSHCFYVRSSPQFYGDFPVDHLVIGFLSPLVLAEH